MNYRTMEVILYIVIMLTAFVVVGKGQTPSDIVAATLILEAGGEYASGSMEAVHEVIVNRSAKRSISAAQVCLQPYQVSCWNSGNLATKLATAQRHPRWVEACTIVASEPTNLTRGADHYHADYCDPYWNKSMTVTIVIGRHIFYR
jgi:spore germination cell wall hydrolase CwlJ-like protein